MPTIRNTKGIDLIVSKDKRVLNIQVKTNSYGQVKFPMAKENEASSDDLFYVFVTLKDFNERPDFYVANSKFVADYIKKTHALWSSSDPKIKLKRYQTETKEQTKIRRARSTLRQFPNYLGKEIFPDSDIEALKDDWKILNYNA